MAKYIELPSYSIENNQFYLNGNLLSTDQTLNLDIVRLNSGEYNIDFLLEYGNNITANQIQIESNDNINLVTTLAERANNILIQCVGVEVTEDHFNFTITYNSNSFNIRINLKDLEEKPIYIPNIQNSQQSSFCSNGVSEYPSSHFDLPLPISENHYIIGWLDQNRNFELGNNDIKVRIYYNRSYFNIDDLGEDQNIADVNRVNLYLDNRIQLQNLEEENYYLPMVFEFRNENDYIVSVRSVLFVRMSLYLQDSWKRILNVIDLPENRDANALKNYRFLSPTPNNELLDSPYVQYWNNIYPGLSTLSKNQIKFNGVTNPNGLNVSILRSTNQEGYELDIDYPRFNSEEINTNISLTLRSTLVQTNWHSLVLKTANPTPSIEIIEPENWNLEKGKQFSFNFKTKNIASVRIILGHEARHEEITDEILNFDIQYLTQYNVSLPHNGLKAYPNLDGFITVSSNNGELGTFTYVLQGLDSEGTVITDQEFTINILRPKAIIETDFTDSKQNVNIDQTYIQHVTCHNVYEVSLREDDFTKFTPTIENITHSPDLQESGTYADYSFDLKIEGKNPGIENLVLIFADDQYDVVYEVNKTFDIFTTNYTPYVPNVNEKNVKNGLSVRISYKERKDYHLPLAFISNGQEADYLLVAKYPLSQDSLDKNGTLKSLSISKGNRFRLEYIEDNFVENSDEGEFHKVANPNITKNILRHLKNNDFLNGNALGVGDSIYLDTLLSNLNDAHYQRCFENMEDNEETNWFFHNRKGLLDTNIEARAYYPERPLKIVENTLGGTWELTGDYGKTEYAYGRLNPELNPSFNSKGNCLLPPILSETHFTHNGQYNGVVEAFGFGVKTYSDVRISYRDGKQYLEVVNPLTEKVEYTDDSEKNFTAIEFQEQTALKSIPLAYIGPNDYPLGTHSGVFYNADYHLDLNASLLDNIGFPKDNMVKEIENDNTFKGNAGYRLHDPHSRYGKSVYRMDLTKIESDSHNLGYIISGLSFNGKLVECGNKEEKEEHISNLYPTYIDGSITGSYRSRMLIDAKALYHINKTSDNKNDQMFFNSRLHFLLYDKERSNLKLVLPKKWIEIEKNSKIDFNPNYTPNAELSVDNPNPTKLYVNLEERFIQALELGKYYFDLILSKEGEQSIKHRVYVEVIEQKALTPLSLTLYSVNLTETDDYVFDVKTPAKSLDISTNSDYLCKVIQSPNNNGNIRCSLHALNKGDAIIKIKAKAKNMKENLVTLNANIKVKYLTEYNLSFRRVTIPLSDINNSIGNKILSLRTKLRNTTITSPNSIGLWSDTLKGQNFVVNPDYSIDIDFGIIDKVGTHRIDYVCQIDADYNQNGVISGEKPYARKGLVKNKHDELLGTIWVQFV